MNRKKMKKARIRFAILIVVILCLGAAGVLLWGQIFSVPADASSADSDSGSGSQSDPGISSASSGKAADKLTLFAVGDNILHQSVLDDAKKSDGSYDFTKYYTQLSKDIKAADVAFVNQESPIGGASFGITGYPSFNSPDEIAANLAQVGFNVVSQANNHVLDKGKNALLKTVECWNRHTGVNMIGISSGERAKPRVIEKNGIKYAFLAYTSLLNTSPLGAADSYMINMADKDQMKADVEYAKSQGAELIFVSMHWGIEYSYNVSTLQRDMANYLSSLGVDVIIGTHPHVLQPIETITSDNGHKTLVYYSLGNFLSSQEEIPRMLGGAARVEFERGADGTIRMTDSSIVPLVTHFTAGKKEFMIYKLSDYTEALASKHGVSAFGETLTLSGLQKLSKNILGSWYQN